MIFAFNPLSRPSPRWEGVEQIISPSGEEKKSGSKEY